MHVYFSSLPVCLLFIASTLNIGLAAQRLAIGRELDWAGLCFSVGLGIFGTGLVGLAVSATPLDMRATATVLLIAGNLLALLGNLRHPPRGLARDGLFGLVLWTALSVVLLVVVQIPLSQPGPLQDGPYVYKRWTLPVRVQHLVGDFPPDNALPAFATEYMARRVPFAEVRPLMPGQEVANRALLQALVFLPFRVIFTHDNEKPDPYPSFFYYNRTWPDTSVLISDRSFANYLAIAIPCNAALLLGLGAVLALFGVPYLKTALVGFGATSPYLLTHTVFTWPKNLAAFFVIGAVLMLEPRVRSPRWAGFLLGLAFWCHPYVTGFELSFALAAVVLFCAALVNRANGRPAPFDPWEMAWGVAVMAATVAPWYLWTTGVLHQSSDMLAQNAGSGGGLLQMVWIRIVNFAYLLYPLDLNAQFVPRGQINNYLAHLVSAVGLVPLLVLPLAVARQASAHPFALVWLGLIPGVLIVAAFGMPFAVPMYHGWQAVWPALLAAALVLLRDEWGPKAVLAAALLQLVVNVGVIALRVGQIA